MNLRDIRTVILTAVAVMVLTHSGSPALAAEGGADETREVRKVRSRTGDVEIVDPYSQVKWDTVKYVHSFSHQHGHDPQVLWDMGFRHLPLSNYYPSRPVYPLPGGFVEKYPDALGAPNAEQHSTIDSGIHFNAIGSWYTTGYGESPRLKAGAAPIEHVFTSLSVFNAKNSPWVGIYRLDLRIAGLSGADGEPAVALTVEGAVECNRKTFATVGDGAIRRRRLTEESPGAINLKTLSDRVKVRLDFDPASTRITQFRMMQGTNRPWRDAFHAALDGTGTDEHGQATEGLLFPDAGGITINHPHSPLPSLLDMLDFDPRVLGIEVWNYHRAFGGESMEFYQRWDEILKTGRRCYGFFVKDHGTFDRGRNVLLTAWAPEATRQEREHEALRAYREGRFFGLLGALAVDDAGRITVPYDYSKFRFAGIAVWADSTGRRVGVSASVTGADRNRRPNTQIRFITDAGVAHIAAGEEAYFAFPRDSSDTITCRYVRIEAFAYPDTHLNGKPLTAEALAAMNVHEISCIHDRLGPSGSSKIDTTGQSPIPVVDMLFSQPILIRPVDRGQN